MAKDNAADKRAMKPGYESNEANQNRSVLDEGIKEYEAKNYPAAISVFSSVLKNDRENTEAIFYSGVSYLSMGEYEIAVNLLQSISPSSPGKFSDAAKWYLSLCYIRKNKISKAKSLLEDLSGRENEYRSNAIKTLQEIK